LNEGIPSSSALSPVAALPALPAALPATVPALIPALVPTFVAQARLPAK